ncbi:MAG: hypothetical protein JXR48_13740, partial [Candidatus Delongbacteria bacterium]|nr:hypothetical protein [Candidatus Delongbacteria bacterium]
NLCLVVKIIYYYYKLIMEVYMKILISKLLFANAALFFIYFLIIILNEILDLPKYFGGNETPVNWAEIYFESITLIVIALISLFTNFSLTKRVRKAESIIPICSHCKKIRVGKDEWKKIEEYFHEYTDTKLSHSLCDECVKELYPKLKIKTNQ